MTAEDAEWLVGSFRLLCGMTAGLALLGGVLLPAPSASPRPRVIPRPPAAALAAAERPGPADPVRIGARAVVPRGARRIGPVPPSASMHLEIGLKVRNQAALRRGYRLPPRLM
jgi:hypothetical protein